MSLTGLAFVLIYFFGLFKALSGRPVFGLYIYTFTFYMNPPDHWWGESLPDLRWSLVSALVTFIAIHIWHKKDKSPWLQSAEGKLFLAFVIWVWVQCFWADSLKLQISIAGMFTKFLLLFYLIQSSIKNRKDLVGFLLIHLAATAYLGLSGYLDNRNYRYEAVGIPALEDGNLLSIHIAPILICCSFLLLCQYKKMKYLLTIPLILCLNTILLTQSRGALGALAATGMASLLFIPKQSKTLFITLAILASLAVGSLVGPQLVERLKKVTDDNEQIDRSAESRLIIIAAQYEIFKLNPIFGMGHKGTLLHSGDYISEEYLTGDSDNRRRGSHNLTMSLLVDHGLIGSGLYLGIFFTLIWKLFQMRPTIINAKDNLPIIYLGCNLGLICMMAATQFSNSIKLEIDILLYSIISLMYGWLRDPASEGIQAKPEQNKQPDKVTMNDQVLDDKLVIKDQSDNYHDPNT